MPMRRSSGWLASASGGRDAASFWSLSGIHGSEEGGPLLRRSPQRHLDLPRFQQFIQRRPHAAHLHLPLFLLPLARGGLFLLKVRQALHHVRRDGCEYLHALFGIERHDRRVPFLRRAVEDLAELLTGQKLVQPNRLDKSRRELREVRC